jgi:hypothetical protein
MDCEYAQECVNLGKSCNKCFNYNFFKPHKEMKGLNKRSTKNKQKKEGIDFENRGTRKYNNAVNKTKDVARRTFGSGAFQFDLGDMVTEEDLTASIAEFKERGSTDSRGAKQITIKKDWLDKLEEEAKERGKDYYFLPFTFKGSDKDYVAMDYDILLSYIQTIQGLHEQNKILRLQLEEED